jgi:hypothetical protein
MMMLNISELHNFYRSKMLVRSRQRRRASGMHGKDEKYEHLNTLVG